ncbi:hypothetical protein ACQP10_24985 [Streptosporangium sandarakinum]|uniref:hypothetical protein n=1 Tax=Streptosporangium sandarakinum TaxID=1260955 RepID=UPI003D92306F
MAVVKRFPSGGEYVEALQNPRLCFNDPELKTATPQLDTLGRPRPISGNFASVFSLTTMSGDRYAIKCFTREVPDQEKRYLAVSNHLRTLPYTWKVGFDYQSRGIMVAGRWYPVLKMEWVEAVGLIHWIENHFGDQTAMLGLADRFAELVADMEKAGVAHGDLQHGNLLVTDSGALKLVDYDGMYVPSLSGLPATEKGHRHYQSPHRMGTEFGPALDRFSVWLIYLSLVAIAMDPSLWRSLHDRDGEYLLLAEEDLTDVQGSARMSSLVGHGAVDVHRLAVRVSDMAARPPLQLPALAPLRQTGATVAAPPASVTSTPVAGGLPTWMSGHISPPAPPPAVTIDQHRNALRGTRLIFLALWVMPGAVSWFLGPLEVVAGLITVLGLVVGLLAGYLVYRGLPESKARRTFASRHEQAVQKTKAALKLSARLEKERDKVHTADAKRIADHDRERQDLQKRHRLDLGNFDRATAQQLGPLDTQLQILAANHDQEMRQALEQVQRQRINERLRHITLRAGDVPGIGDGTIAKLRAHGIRTPADFVDIVSVAGYQSPEVHFVLPNGNSVHIHGVGEARAFALEVWRIHHYEAALNQPGIPTTLPQGIRQQIELRHAAEKQLLQQQRSSLEKNRKTQRADLRRHQAEEDRRLAERHSLAVQKQAASHSIASVNQQLANARTEYRAAVQAEQVLTREALIYRQVSYRRFLRAVLTGH